MGWTWKWAENYDKHGKIDRKTECDAIMNSTMVDGKNTIIGKFEVLRSAMVGSTYYGAIKRTKFATETEPEQSLVFAVIIRTSVVNTDQMWNFGYKDMGESMGPCEDKCPKGILDLLSPTDNNYALSWRKRCRENLEKKKGQELGNLRVGSVVEITAKGVVYQFTKSIKTLVYDRTGKLARVETKWRTPYCQATSHCINSWGFKVIHSASKEEAEQIIKTAEERY